MARKADKQKKIKPPQVLTLASVWECGSSLDCTDTSNRNVAHSPAVIKRQCKEECVHSGYDSDPEDFARTTITTVVAATINNKENEQLHPVVNVEDEDAVQTLVQEFLNEKITLILHQDSRSSRSSTQAKSQAVHVWVERGQNLHDRIILPKLVWTPIAKKTKKSGSRIQYQRNETCCVELLDISRIIEVGKLDRRRYPFVRVANAFLIKSVNEFFIFEASSEHERNRIIETLKLLVARFAAKILLKDSTAIDEFFAFSAPGPGEKPHWLNTDYLPRVNN
jgi:hypothetical protein